MHGLSAPLGPSRLYQPASWTGSAGGMGPTSDAHRRRAQFSRHLLALLAVNTLATGETRSDWPAAPSGRGSRKSATRLPAGPVQALTRTGLSTVDLGRVGLFTTSSTISGSDPVHRSVPESSTARTFSVVRLGAPCRRRAAGVPDLYPSSLSGKEDFHLIRLGTLYLSEPR
jgi:hypothetical protein